MSTPTLISSNRRTVYRHPNARTTPSQQPGQSGPQPTPPSPPPPSSVRSSAPPLKPKRSTRRRPASVPKPSSTATPTPTLAPTSVQPPAPAPAAVSKPASPAVLLASGATSKSTKTTQNRIRRGSQPGKRTRQPKPSSQHPYSPPTTAAPSSSTAHAGTASPSSAAVATPPLATAAGSAPSNTTTPAPAASPSSPNVDRVARRIMDGIHAPIVKVLEVPQSADPALSAARVGNVEYLGSYNWIDGAESEPTIVVPGSPPVWKAGLMVPFTLTPDSCPRYIDQNACRIPSSPLAPLFAAVNALGKPIDWFSVDFVVDLDCLRRLMVWLDGNEHAIKKEGEFRIDLELEGLETVLMHRWEKRLVMAPKKNTFGHSFEEKATREAEGCGGSTGYYRIVRYDFFGFSMVVRSNADACLPKVGVAEPRSPASRRGSTPFDLAEFLADMNADGPPPSPPTSSTTPSPPPSSSPSATTTPASSIKIIRASKEIPQRALIELMTRTKAGAYHLDWPSLLPPLYLAALPTLYVGVHEHGTFTAVHEYNVHAERRKLGEAVEKRFERLGRALEVIQDLVVEHGAEGRLSLLFRKGVMRVYKRKSGARFLEEEVRRRFVAR